MKLRISEETMTFGDLEDFEEYSGMNIQDAFKPVPVLDDEGKKVFDERGRPITEVKPSAKSIVAICWIIGRKDNKGFTLEDARNTSISEIEWDVTPEKKESPENSEQS